MGLDVAAAAAPRLYASATALAHDQLHVSMINIYGSWRDHCVHAGMTMCTWPRTYGVWDLARGRAVCVAAAKAGPSRASLSGPCRGTMDCSMDCSMRSCMHAQMHTADLRAHAAELCMRSALCFTARKHKLMQTDANKTRCCGAPHRGKSVGACACGQVRCCDAHIARCARA